MRSKCFPSSVIKPSDSQTKNITQNKALFFGEKNKKTQLLTNKTKHWKFRTKSKLKNNKSDLLSLVLLLHPYFCLPLSAFRSDQRKPKNFSRSEEKKIQTNITEIINQWTSNEIALQPPTATTFTATTIFAEFSRNFTI